MPPKGKGKKKKVLFDPFQRLATETCIAVAGRAPLETQPAEFTDTSLSISPALPRTEVGLRIQFRCSVHINVGDTVTIYLPNFKGASRMFSLETKPHPDGLNIARCFQAYWSGDEKFKKKGYGKNGMTPKQALVLRCIKRLDENTLIVFGVPMALCLISPDKIVPNTGKMKIEGKISYAEGGKIAKQSFLSITEIKKHALLEELDAYDQLMARLVETGGLSKTDRFVGEELTLEEVDQLWEAAQTRTTFPTAMPWVIMPRVFHEYEDAGAYVKKIMECAVAFVKKHDALTLHRQIAQNWGVKVGAVVVFEDALYLQCAGLYPGLTRSAILAAHLITMEPVDVARTFNTNQLPANSILQELTSAFRSQGTIGRGQDASAIPSRCEEILDKWSAVISALFTATMIICEDLCKKLSARRVQSQPPTRHASAEPRGVDDDAAESGSPVTVEVAEGEGAAPAAAEPAARFTFPRPFSGAAQTSPTSASIRQPPTLYVGLRDVEKAELEHLQQMRDGDWYMFPFFVTARQSFPLQLDATPEEEAANAANDDSAEPVSIPDGGVVFEIRNAIEGLELADLSAYPHNREWLLPFSSSFRIISVSVKEDHNDLTHVVMEMSGSLVGCMMEEYIPEGDRGVATMVLRKIQLELEYSESRAPQIAQLAYANVKRHLRSRLHPPLLMRAQYLIQYHEVKRASAAKDAVESGVVVWQVCTHPAQRLEEGVIRPSMWEALPKKFAPAAEAFFLSRSRDRRVLTEGGLQLDLNTYVVDYAGKGPRPVRRVVDNRITHEAPTEPLQALMEKEAISRKQLQVLNVKLGLTPDGKPITNPAPESKRRSGAPPRSQG